MTHTTIEARSVQVTADSVALEGTLNIPESPQGLVVFVHGSGSSRNSSRNRHVARVLQEGSLATLLFNLLTAQEERVDRVTRHLRFDIDLLASRTTGAIDWVQQQPEARDLPLGLFGASTGAAAALIAATRRPQAVRAVVTRSGRPDLAGLVLKQVKRPVLLSVGGLDMDVITLNKKALAQMRPDPPKALVVVPGASHLFEESGALEKAAQLARDWFQQYLPGGEAARPG